MSGWLHSQLANTLFTDTASNKFTFDHGREAYGASPRLQRANDQRLAALLLEAGLTEVEVFAAPRDSEDQILSRDGEWTESLGRALRRSQMFASQAFAAKIRHGLRYTAFTAKHGIDKVRQIRVAAPACSVPLDALRHAHADTSRRVADRLRYGVKRHAPGVAVDLISAHIKRDGDGCVYLHFHVVARGGTPAEWAALERYWIGAWDHPTGWLWWHTNDEDERLDRHPAALVQYAAAGLAEELDEEWTPEELAELWRQTRGLSLIRAVGEYRRWLGDLDRNGLTVRRGEYGVAEIVPRRPVVRVRRLRESLFRSSGFTVLRLVMHDFGDGVLRESWHVRGRPDVTASDVRAVYATFTDTTANPESSSSPAPSPSKSNTPAPVSRPGTPVWPPPGARTWGPPPRPDPATLDQAPF